MSLILLDESVPVALRRLLTGHDARSVIYMGWSALKNGELIAQAETEGFDITITADQNIRYQQNMTGRRLALIMLDTNHWRTIRANYQRVLEAVEACTTGGLVKVAIRGSAGQVLGRSVPISPAKPAAPSTPRSSHESRRKRRR